VNDEHIRDFAFLLTEVSRRFVLRFEAHAGSISLNLLQCKTLVCLEKNEGMSQVRLAGLVGVDAMTMVRIIDRMEAEGLLERRPDPADRRSRCLYLTPRATPLLHEIRRLVDLNRAEAFEGIRGDDLQVFMDVLERMEDNLSKLDRKAAMTVHNVGH
jgi:MarR family transcriptional regulator for hemolysin